MKKNKEKIARNIEQNIVDIAASTKRDVQIAYQFVFTKHDYMMKNNCVICNVGYKVVSKRAFCYDTEIFSGVATGVAHCNALDDFNTKTGKQIARAKAEKKAFEYVERRFRKALEILDNRLDEIFSIRTEMNKVIEHQIEYLKTF